MTLNSDVFKSNLVRGALIALGLLIVLAICASGTVRNIAIGLLFIAFSGIGFYMTWYGNREIQRTRGWSTTPGVILERGVGAPMGGGSRSYMPHVKYTYTVGGVEYTNDQVYLIRNTGSRPNSIIKLVNSFPNPVPVRYDPNNPAQSYLIDTPHWLIWLPGVLGILFIGLGVMMIVQEIVP